MEINGSAVKTKQSKTVFRPPRHSTPAERIGSEIRIGFAALDGIDKAVAVFGGARVKKDSPSYESACRLGEFLSERGFAIVTGGGPGIMEAANAGASLSGKSPSVGLNIELANEQLPNTYQDTEIHFQHFASRKVTFCKVADAFVVYPGGFGTIDELGEILTLIQTEQMERVPVFLVGRAFWGPFMAMFDNMLKQGLVSSSDSDLFSIVDEEEVCERIEKALVS